MIRLEIGAGARAHDGYVAFDVNPENADVVGDALHLPFRTATVAGIRAVDVLEHISYRDTDRALREWARVCVSGAALYVQVPDAATIMRWFVDGDARLRRTDRSVEALPIQGAEWRLLGGHADGKYVDVGGDWRWNAHYSLWEENWLKAALAVAGFRPVRLRRNDHPNLLVDAVRA